MLKMSATSDTVSIGILIVISPGESELAGDSIRRVLAHSAALCDVFVVNNSGLVDADQWWHDLGIASHRLNVIVPRGCLPRPYFEIARTIFAALHEITPVAPDLIFKLDPDTLVLSRAFFTDILELHLETGADFYACHARAAARDHLRRLLRISIDLCPIGLYRSAGGDRYGKTLKLRTNGVWYANLKLRAVRRMQPSGGFYALRGGFLRTLALHGMLTTDGMNGLEWNDDTLLPIAVQSAGGLICDVRETRFASGWRWMHGSPYFTEEQALATDIRAVHPSKFDEAGKTLRRRLDSV
jgi:hypothetical protein